MPVGKIFLVDDVAGGEASSEFSTATAFFRWKNFILVCKVNILTPSRLGPVDYCQIVEGLNCSLIDVICIQLPLF